MAIKDILKMYSGPLASTTEDGRMLALSLAEIQTELMALREELGKNAGTPTTAISTIDTSALEAAISQLKPLPPQDLDLNPVYRSYEQTAQAIRELLGEVKTTNHRLMGSFGGGGGPSVVGLNDATGNRLIINPDGSLNTTSSGTPAPDPNLPDLTGTWGYKAGVSGTPSIPALARVIGIAAHGTVAATLTINAGDSIPIPAGTAISLTPTAQLISPTLVFTSTDSYMVEYLT